MTFNRYSSNGIMLQTDDGTPYLSGLPFVEFEYSGPVKLHEVSINEIGRPDLIAWKRLKDVSLWPYILWFNNITDPLVELNNVVIQMDDQGLPMYDAQNNLILVPNVIRIPMDISKFVIIPRAYQQDVS
jgi:hypothetical protein